jgi:DNA-binding response OmpR family regulator
MAKILIVEDESLVARLVRLVLTTDGHEVDVACDGSEALRRLQTSTPDTILLDLTMPQMDGPTFFRTAREKGYAGPIIILSSALEGDRVAAELGAQAFVPKPFEPEYLQSVVHDVLRVGARAQSGR